MIPYIAIAVWIGTLWLDLYTDTRPNKTVNHTRGFLLRILPFVAIFILSPWHWWAFFLFGFMCLFNMLRNIWLKQKPFRIGTTAWSDKLMRKYKWIQPALWGAFVGAIAFIIQYYL